MIDAKAFRQLPILAGRVSTRLAMAKPLPPACEPIRHIAGALHHGRPRGRRCRSAVAARTHDLNAQVVVLNVLR
jgi:hypothetical protein